MYGYFNVRRLPTQCTQWQFCETCGNMHVDAPTVPLRRSLLYCLIEILASALPTPTADLLCLRLCALCTSPQWLMSRVLLVCYLSQVVYCDKSCLERPLDISSAHAFAFNRSLKAAVCQLLRNPLVCLKALHAWLPSIHCVEPRHLNCKCLRLLIHEPSIGHLFGERGGGRWRFYIS